MGKLAVADLARSAELLYCNGTVTVGAKLPISISAPPCPTAAPVLLAAKAHRGVSDRAIFPQPLFLIGRTPQFFGCLKRVAGDPPLCRLHNLGSAGVFFVSSSSLLIIHRQQHQQQQQQPRG